MDKHQLNLRLRDTEDMFMSYDDEFFDVMEKDTPDPEIMKFSFSFYPEEPKSSKQD